MAQIGLGLDQRGDGAHRRRKERPVGREAVCGAQSDPRRTGATARPITLSRPCHLRARNQYFQSLAAPFPIHARSWRHGRHNLSAADTPSRPLRQARSVGKATLRHGRRIPGSCGLKGSQALPTPGAESIFSSLCGAIFAPSSVPPGLGRRPPRRCWSSEAMAFRPAKGRAHRALAGPLGTARVRAAWLHGKRTCGAVSLSGVVRTKVEHTRLVLSRKCWFLLAREPACVSPSTRPSRSTAATNGPANCATLLRRQPDEERPWNICTR